MSTHTHDENPEVWERGALDVSTGRRTLLKAGAAGIAISAVAGALGTSRADAAVTTAKRCYVLVLDGTRPEELDLGITPNITALRDGGLRYPRALSQPIMETIPNHVMMMTGVHPDRTGVPANTIWDQGLGKTRDMDQKTDIKAPTLHEQLRAAGYTTGSVLSKTYLYGVFQDRATYQWEPTLALPITGHEIDQMTMPAAIAMIKASDPHFMFINLGDIDRFGHADVTGGITDLLLGGQPLPLLRRAVLADTDLVVGNFISTLKSEGHWDNALVIVLADHCMDWSSPNDVVSMTSVFNTDSSLKGNFQIACNGGADLVYWTGESDAKAAGLAKMRTLATATTGILSVHTPAELKLGGPCGDLVVYAKKGWRLSDPTAVSNPIPGNHGHPTTRPIPFFLAGGAIKHAAARSTAAATLDVAPTVGAYFGIRAPAGGWVGSSRL